MELYKIIEVVKAAVGSIPGHWASRKKLKLLKYTSEHEKVAGPTARHARLANPPKQPMSLDEARTTVRKILESWALEITKP
jgi:hypothetical protein